MAAAVLIAGTATGHAAPQAGGHGDPPQTAAQGHDGHHPAPAHDHADCVQAAKSGQPAKHGTMHGCCANACFPTLTTQEFAPDAGLSFWAERLTAPADRAAASRSPDGLLRPPRRRI